jgi:hypothetical protein
MSNGHRNEKPWCGPLSDMACWRSQGPAFRNATQPPLETEAALFKLLIQPDVGAITALLHGFIRAIIGEDDSWVNQSINGLVGWGSAELGHGWTQ